MCCGAMLLQDAIVTKPKVHPYGVSATFSKVRVEDGERPSQTLIRCLGQQVGQEAKSVFLLSTSVKAVPRMSITTGSCSA
jgi:hypothetical protein